MIMSIKTKDNNKVRVYTRLEANYCSEITKDQYADELFWLLVQGIKSELITSDELEALVRQASKKVEHPEMKEHGTQKSPLTKKHKSIRTHGKQYLNGVEYCAHQNIDNCRWCEFSLEPEDFDPGCILRVEEDDISQGKCPD